MRHLIIVACCALLPCAGACGDLSLWRDEAPARKAILEYVESVTREGSSDYIPPIERIAVFDFDGTLFCETAPTYFDWLLFERRVLDDPTYSAPKELRAAAEAARHDGKIQGLSYEREKLMADAYKGMSLEWFDSFVRGFMEEPHAGFTNMKRGDAFYRPMVQVVELLAKKGFRVYVCSGSDRQILRAVVPRAIDLPPHRMIGSDSVVVAEAQNGRDGLSFTYGRGDRLVFGGALQVKNLQMNKVVAIKREIGVKPVLSFGNSFSDASMANYVLQDNPRRAMAFMLLCDDTAREYGNPEKAEKLRRACGANGWFPVSMRDDWKTIYGEGVEKRVQPKVNEREVITFEKPDKSPIWFGGESRCEGVGCGGNYSVFIDVYHDDGSHTWALEAPFMRGTHGWMRVESVHVPRRPVKKVHLYRLLRGTEGRADFRGVFLRREFPEEGRVLSERRFAMRPYRDADRVERLVARGRRTRREFSEEKSESAAAAGAGATIVWTADSMLKVLPSTAPSARQAESRSICLELAGGERESAQICVTAPRGAKAESVAVSVGRLASASGEILDGGVEVRRIGYFARLDGFEGNPFGDDPGELWFPEPLLPEDGMRTSPGGTQGAWITFMANRGAKAGVYSGEALVKVGAADFRVPVEIRVRGFSLPERFGMKTAYSVMDGFTRALYPDDFEAKRRETWDIMLDHRLNPTDISRTAPPKIEDVEYAVKRGMSCWNVLNLVPPAPNSRWVCRAEPERVFNEGFRRKLDETLGPYVAELRRRGLDKGAYLYGFDECGPEYFEKMDAMWKDLKASYGLPMMTTAMMFRDVVEHRLEFSSPLATMTDIHCPLLSVYDAALADRYRAMGREVWWYVCCSPRYPHLNVAPYSHPVVEARLAGWLTRLVRADGFLYWHVNYWRGTERLDERMTYFPDWRTDTLRIAHGDGVFMYPGREHVVPGIRLANVRDGVEDYEWLALASEKVGRNAVEAAIGRLARSTTDFSRDPALLRSVRSRIGDMIEGVGGSTR